MKLADFHEVSTGGYSSLNHAALSISICLFSLIAPAGYTQNLVPNPGFEEYTYLPCNLNELLIQHMLQNWFQPIPTSTDYWSTLSGENCFLNPVQDKTEPRTGSGMVGLVTATLLGGNKIPYKEYVEVKLSEKIRKGGLYNVEMFARNWLRHGNLQSNNLGAAFSEVLIHYPVGRNSPVELTLPPAVTANEIMDETWQKVGGCYQADKDYEYLLIGNFKPVDSTIIKRIGPARDDEFAYYLIDDVSVSELPYDVEGLDRIATYCPDDEFIELNALVEGAVHYAWDSGEETPSLTINAKVSKDYFVDITFNECTYKHKFTVKYLPPLSLGPDTLLCHGETLQINPDYPAEDFRWSDNSLDLVRQITSAGTFSLKILTDDCDIIDALTVDFIDCPGFIPNVITPNGDEFNQSLIIENIDNRKWSLRIYNRWGKLLYFSSDYNNTWDGGDAEEGVYYYHLSSEELKKSLKGSLHIMR